MELPAERFRATGTGAGVHVHDPDGSLIAFIPCTG